MNHELSLLNMYGSSNAGIITIEWYYVSVMGVVKVELVPMAKISTTKC